MADRQQCLAGLAWSVELINRDSYGLDVHLGAAHHWLSASMKGRRSTCGQVPRHGSLQSSLK